MCVCSTVRYMKPDTAVALAATNQSERQLSLPCVAPTHEHAFEDRSDKSRQPYHREEAHLLIYNLKLKFESILRAGLVSLNFALFARYYESDKITCIRIGRVH